MAVNSEGSYRLFRMLGVPGCFSDEEGTGTDPEFCLLSLAIGVD